jgi:hypothetical protein
LIKKENAFFENETKNKMKALAKNSEGKYITIRDEDLEALILAFD